MTCTAGVVTQELFVGLMENVRLLGIYVEWRPCFGVETFQSADDVAQLQVAGSTLYRSKVMRDSASRVVD